MKNYQKFKDEIKHIKKTIPQILAFTNISKNGVIFFKNKIMNFLNIDETQPITITIENEVLLSVKDAGVKLTILPGNKLQLPSYVIKKLDITKKTKICFVQRKHAIAMKKFKIEIITTKFPRIIDIETPYLVTRRIETFGDPLEIYELMKKKMEDYKLKYNIKKFWQNKKSFYAWKARQILGASNKSDKELQIDLIQERLQLQKEDGSWNNNVILTAKNILELSELGLNSNHPQIQKSITWLLEQMQSKYNPGMFFLNENLVKEQSEIIDRRIEQASGPRDRFRKRVSSEIKQITTFDELYFNPCGQRIIWANAIVMEALLAYGYEYHNRIQTAFDTIAFTRWCECAYQHGKSDWNKKNSMSLLDIEKFQKQTLFEFKHGGIYNLKTLAILPTKNHFLRIKEESKKDYTEYTLRMPIPQQGCEYITAGALYQVKNEKISNLVQAHLWRFIVLLYNALQQPKMVKEMEKNNLTYYFQLQVLGKYDSLPAKLGILFALPWILEHQNENGSWGEGKITESATLAIIKALNKIIIFDRT
ncbi:MAG: hypothetical protein FK731_04320 [Asgard group archaeon]|nr:hypothetical protein [Asgard group archaeon]